MLLPVLLMAGLQMFVFVRNVNLEYAYWWKYDANTRNAIVRVAQASPDVAGAVDIGATWRFAAVMNFYRETLSLSNVRPVERDGLRTSQHDYYYVAGEDESALPPGATTIVHWPLSDSTLARAPTR